MSFEVETRDGFGDIQIHQSIAEAMEYANDHSSVWQLSFEVASGEVVQLTSDAYDHVNRKQTWLWKSPKAETEERTAAEMLANTVHQITHDDVAAQRANYYTRTVTLESDLDWRHLRIVRFEEAPTEELDF